jgi:hypothetical protein
VAPFSKPPGCGAVAERPTVATGTGDAEASDCPGPARERNATPDVAPSVARSTPTAIMLPTVLLPAERTARIALATARAIIRSRSNGVQRTMRGMTGSAHPCGGCSRGRVIARGSATGVAGIVRNSTG